MASGTRFFDGALSHVSANRAEAKGVKLPGGVTFGEDISQAASKLKSLGITLDKTESEGRVMYSSDYVLKSSAGVRYSIELRSDERGALNEVIERTYF